ncbi:peptidase S24, partial [Acinetobacter sp. JS678]
GKNLKSAFLPLIAQFLGVDGYWLTTGNTEDAFRESDVFSPTVVSAESTDQYAWIEVVEASFSCGTGESIEFHFDAINGKIPFPASFFKEKRVAQECMRIIKAKGDSMTDYIKDGDLVGIDISQTEVIDGEIYAVYFAGEGIIKQIFKEADGSLILHSLNEKFRDRRVTEENGKNFKVMGRQFWRAG